MPQVSHDAVCEMRLSVQQDVSGAKLPEAKNLPEVYGSSNKLAGHEEAHRLTRPDSVGGKIPPRSQGLDNLGVATPSCGGTSAARAGQSCLH